MDIEPNHTPPRFMPFAGKFESPTANRSAIGRASGYNPVPVISVRDPRCAAGGRADPSSNRELLRRGTRCSSLLLIFVFASALPERTVREHGIRWDCFGEFRIIVPAVPRHHDGEIA
jgi:hypothetical protein